MKKTRAERTHWDTTIQRGRPRPRPDIIRYFLGLVKERSATEIKTFYSYFGSHLKTLFEGHLNKGSDHPIRIAYDRGDVQIFNQIINLNPTLFVAKIQYNDVSSKAHNILPNFINFNTLFALESSSVRNPPRGRQKHNCTTFESIKRTQMLR